LSWKKRPFDVVLSYIGAAIVAYVQGRVVALDKSKNKLAKLTENVQRWNVSCVDAYSCDATKTVDQTAGSCGLSQRYCR